MEHGLLQQRLRRLFNEGFTAMDIAEPLLSFDEDRDALQTREYMSQCDLDIVGVRVQGTIAGYLSREDLTGGCCRDHMRQLAPGSVLPCSASYRDVIRVLDRSGYCFISSMGQVIGYARREDMGKPSVRMWLFGMVTLVEIRITQAVEVLFPGETWKELLPPDRLAKAEALVGERRRRGQHVHLVQALQLVDKASIVIRNQTVREDMGFSSKNQARKALSDFESLRNNLAHANDIVTYDWDMIVELANRLDRMLSRPIDGTPIRTKSEALQDRAEGDIGAR